MRFAATDFGDGKGLRTPHTCAIIGWSVSVAAW
jgi:hypothetical protein